MFNSPGRIPPKTVRLTRVGNIGGSNNSRSRSKQAREKPTQTAFSSGRRHHDDGGMVVINSWDDFKSHLAGQEPRMR